MLKGLGDAASAIVLVAVLLTTGALSLVDVQVQPVFQIMRNVMLAALGGSTPGINIQGEPNKPKLNCNFETGVCTWE